MTRNKRPLPPEHLGSETAAWWSVSDAFDLEQHHLRLLTLAAEAWDRGQQAREALSDAGALTFTDRSGAPRARPEVAIERDSRIAFARLMRELDLDAEPTRDPRPPRR